MKNRNYYWYSIRLLLAITSCGGILNLYILISYFGQDLECNHGNPSVLRRQISSIDTPSEERENNGPRYGHLELLNLGLKDILNRYTETVDSFGGEFKQALARPLWIREENKQGGIAKFPQLIMIPSCPIPPFLLILVHSSPESFTRREAIRLSWGRQDNTVNQGSWNRPERTWKTVFLIGRSNNSNINALVQREAHEYDDVIIGDFPDTYRHLSMKMLCGITWPLKYCTAKFILKSDDDCFINVIPLLLWLGEQRSLRSSQVLYIGRVQKNMEVVRDKGHRYFVSRTQHPSNYFKPYVSGGGYLFSGNLLSKLFRVSKRTRIFPVEDALLGVLMDKLGVARSHDNRFLPFVSCKDETLFRRPMCDFRDPFVIHGVTETQQIYMHYNVLIMNFVPTVCSYVEQQSKEGKVDTLC